MRTASAGLRQVLPWWAHKRLTQNQRDRRAAEPVLLIGRCFKPGADMPLVEPHSWVGRESHRTLGCCALRGARKAADDAIVAASRRLLGRSVRNDRGAEERILAVLGVAFARRRRMRVPLVDVPRVETLGVSVCGDAAVRGAALVPVQDRHSHPPDEIGEQRDTSGNRMHTDGLKGSGIGYLIDNQSERSVNIQRPQFIKLAKREPRVRVCSRRTFLRCTSRRMRLIRHARSRPWLSLW